MSASTLDEKSAERNHRPPNETHRPRHLLLNRCVVIAFILTDFCCCRAISSGKLTNEGPEEDLSSVTSSLSAVALSALHRQPVIAPPYATSITNENTDDEAAISVQRLQRPSNLSSIESPRHSNAIQLLKIHRANAMPIFIKHSLPYNFSSFEHPRNREIFNRSNEKLRQELLQQQRTNFALLPSWPSVYVAQRVDQIDRAPKIASQYPRWSTSTNYSQVIKLNEEDSASSRANGRPQIINGSIRVSNDSERRFERIREQQNGTNFSATSSSYYEPILLATSILMTAFILVALATGVYVLQHSKLINSPKRTTLGGPRRVFRQNMSNSPVIAPPMISVGPTRSIAKRYAKNLTTKRRRTKRSYKKQLRDEQSKAARISKADSLDSSNDPSSVTTIEIPYIRPARTKPAQQTPPGTNVLLVSDKSINTDEVAPVSEMQEAKSTQTEVIIAPTINNNHDSLEAQRGNVDDDVSVVRLSQLHSARRTQDGGTLINIDSIMNWRLSFTNRFEQQTCYQEESLPYVDESLSST